MDDIGDFIDERCPKCGCTLLANKSGEKWCSYILCDFGLEEWYKEIKGEQHE